MSTQVAEYSKTEAALGDLRKRFKGITWDVSTTAGDKDARPTAEQIINLVASTYKVSADTARGWINQITNMEKAA